MTYHDEAYQYQYSRNLFHKRYLSYLTFRAMKKGNDYISPSDLLSCTHFSKIIQVLLTVSLFLNLIPVNKLMINHPKNTQSHEECLLYGNTFK